MKISTRCLFVALICINFAIYMAATILEAGYYNSPHGTTDSKGNPLGFNDPITLELYGIIFRNADWGSFWERIGWYSGLYLLMQAVGLIVVLTKEQTGIVKAKWRRNYFSIQPILFLPGWLGFLLLPAFLLGADGETISDGIPLGWIFQPIWFAICISLAVFYSRIVVRSTRVIESAC